MSLIKLHYETYKTHKYYTITMFKNVNYPVMLYVIPRFVIQTRQNVQNSIRNREIYNSSRALLNSSRPTFKIVMRGFSKSSRATLDFRSCKCKSIATSRWKVSFLRCECESFASAECCTANASSWCKDALALHISNGKSDYFRLRIVVTESQSCVCTPDANCI